MLKNNSVFFCVSVLRDQVKAVSGGFVRKIWAHEKKKKSYSKWIGKATTKHVGKINIKRPIKWKTLGDAFTSEEMELINKSNMIFNLHMTRMFKEVNEGISCIKRRHFGLKRGTDWNRKRWKWKKKKKILETKWTFIKNLIHKIRQQKRVQVKGKK